MKVPKSPPNFRKLFNENLQSFQKIYEAVRSPLHRGKYLHWNDLRYKTPPADLSLEQYWLGLKIRRDPLLQEVRLKDTKGFPFKFLQPDPIPQLLHQIDLSAGGRIEMVSSGLGKHIANPESKDRYYLSSLIEEALTSSQIEGAIATREVAEEMVRSGRKPRDKSEKMVLNNFITMKRIGELRHERLTPDLVLEIHRLITDDTLNNPAAAGRLRSPSEPVDVGNEVDGTVYHLPPDASELPDRMRAMCDFANSEKGDEFVHPVLRAVLLHFWLAYDHPFVDGNGRTARALFYWSMLRSGYWLFEFVSISHIINRARIAYYKAFLYTETDDNDLTYFIIYHLDVMNQAIVSLNKYITRKTAELRAVEQEIHGVRIFNYRQRALISHALRHPSHVYTIESHRRSHNVVHQTARTDLLQLCEMGMLNQSKQGRRWQFSPVRDLESRLRELPE